MREYKHGTLPRGRGGKVKSRKQAVAIALREAGASKYESPKKNRANLRKTARKSGARKSASRKAARKSRKTSGKSAPRKPTARKSAGRNKRA